jgi:iron complex outermembrane recepter protein
METKTTRIPPPGVSFIGVQSISHDSAKRKRTAVTGFCLLLLSAHSALAQATPPSRTGDADKSDVVELEQISVTGSHIRMSTTEADKGALPIELISESKFQLTSGERISDFVRSSPVISGPNLTFANAERNNAAAQTGAANSHSFQESFNLRGFGGGYTLTLVNGRRFGGEGIIPDVSIIPSEAVESVEILKSGASAVYGTDAVAGVVNLKLKDRFEGVEILASYGNTTDRDAGVQRYAVLFGAGEGKFRIVGSANWHEHAGIMKWDRTLTSTRDFRPYGGADLRSSNLALPQRVYLGTAITGTGLVLDGTRFSPGQVGTSPSDYVPPTQDSQKVSTNEPATLPPYNSFGAHWLAEYDVLDNRRMTVFAEGFYENRDIRFQYLTTGVAQITAQPTQPFNPFGQLVTIRYTFGPNEVRDLVPRLAVEKNAVHNTFGVKGDLGRWNYEIAYTRYDQSLVEKDQYNADFAKVQAAVNAGTFNPFGFWTNSFELSKTLLMDERVRTMNQSLDAVSANVNGSLFELPAGDLHFAVGAEQREAVWNENYDEGWRTRRSVWYVEGPQLGFTERSRTVEGYFGELQAPVWRARNSESFFSSVDVSGAVRYETLGGGGSITVPQGAVRLSLLDDSLVVRASYGESFRAPSLANLSAPVTTTVATVNTFLDPIRGGNFPFTVTQGGNPDLKPEKGENLNVGVIFTPRQLPQLTLKADYWKISVSDIIVIPSIQDLYNGISPVGSITRDASQYPTFDIRVTNGGVIDAEGIDLGASYHWDLGSLGRVTVDGSATYMTTFERLFGPTVTEFLGNWTAGYGAMPKLRAVGGASWRKGPWEAGTFVHYKGGMNELVGGKSRRIEEYATGDIQVAYNFGPSAHGLLRNTRIHAGVENWWDQDLSFVNTSADGWDRESDYRGRYVYVGFRKKL